MNILDRATIAPGHVETADILHLPLTGPGLRPANERPRVLEAEGLAAMMEDGDVMVVDVRSPEQCVDGHVPGAVMLEYSDLLHRDGPATGLLPGPEQLSRVLSAIGLHPERHVVAYNDDNGSHAARLLWTLDLLGHGSYSLLSGGFAAWDEFGLPVEPAPARPSRTRYRAEIRRDGWAHYDDVLSYLDDPDVVLLDTRSPEEFSGRQVRAARGGHIPGAVNFDWTLAVDLTDNGRLRPDDELLQRLHDAGVTPDKQIVPYCHTHHRSAHTAFVLQHLGYPRVRAYPGSWSEWGNRDDAPVTEGAG